MKKLGILALAVIAVASVVAMQILSPQPITRTTPLLVKGHVRLVLYAPSGDVIDVRDQDNLITNAGFDAICEQISGNTGDNFTWIAIGSGTTAVAGSDTYLEAELARSQGAYAHTVGTKTFTVTSTFGANVGTGAITEAGVLNAAAGGTLLCRQTFAVINKGAGDTLQITWTFTIS